MYMLWVRLPGRQCFNVLLVVKKCDLLYRFFLYNATMP